MSWVKGLSMVLRTLIFTPNEEPLVNTEPQRFKNITQDIHFIFDAREIFTETPKNPDDQKKTWSEYKNHNNLNVLITVTPNSFINFVSKTYKSAVSDEKLTLKGEYLEKLVRYSIIMTDKGFNFQNECLSYLLLYILPGKVKHTKWFHLNLLRQKLANIRILVEQVIRQIKTFNILGN